MVNTEFKHFSKVKCCVVVYYGGTKNNRLSKLSPSLTTMNVGNTYSGIYRSGKSKKVLNLMRQICK